MQREIKDSLGQKSLNLCEATESVGGRLEVIRTFPFASRDNPRSTARRRQTLSTATRLTVFDFGDREWRQFVSRHPHLHQSASAKAEQGLQDKLEKATRAYRDPVYLARSLRTQRVAGRKDREYDGCDSCKASHSITRAWNAKDLARGRKRGSRRARSYWSEIYHIDKK